MTFFATDLDLLPGEDASAVSAQIEDSQQRVMQVPVEFVGKVPNFESFTQIVIKLPPLIIGDGTRFSISLRGSSSNSVPLSYRPEN